MPELAGLPEFALNRIVTKCASLFEFRGGLGVSPRCGERLGQIILADGIIAALREKPDRLIRTSEIEQTNAGPRSGRRVGGGLSLGLELRNRLLKLGGLRSGSCAKYGLDLLGTQRGRCAEDLPNVNRLNDRLSGTHV